LIDNRKVTIRQDYLSPDYKAPSFNINTGNGKAADTKE